MKYLGKAEKGGEGVMEEVGEKIGKGISEGIGVGESNEVKVEIPLPKPEK